MPEPSFSDDFLNKWEHLINDIEITDVPLRFISEVVVFFHNGDQMEFDIKEMLQSPFPVAHIEEEIETFLSENDRYIDNVDFHINIPAVATEIETKTNKLLDKA